MKFLQKISTGILCCALLVSLVSAVCQNEGSFTSASGTQLIESDADGRGTGTVYDEGETCSWTLTCDAGEFAIIRSRGLIGTGEVITYNNGATDFTTITSSNDFNAWRGFISDTNTIVVSWVSDSDGNTNRGWEANIWCAPAQCSDSRTVTTITTFPSTFDTDTNGPGTGHRHYLGENCNWPLQCPAGKFPTYTAAAVRSSAISNSPNAEINIQDSSQSNLAQFTTATTPVAPGTPGELVIGTSNVGYVKFTSTYDSNAGYGFDFTVDCLDYQCSLNTNAVSTYPTTLMSDADGSAAASLHHRGENCDITVTCPGGMFGVFTYVGDIAAASGSVRFESTAAALVTQYDSSITTAVKTVHSANEYVLKYVTSSSVTATNGFTITHDCLSSQCTMYTGANPSTSYPVALSSDADGHLGSTQYAQGEACVIQLSCPAGFLAKVTYEVATADANDALEILDGTNANLAGPFSGTTLQSGIVFSSNNIAKLAWTTNTDGILGDGFTATLDCGVTACNDDPAINENHIATPESLKIQSYPSLPNSKLSCPSNIVAGQRGICTIELRGHCGDLYGVAADTPMIAMTICPKEHWLSNGNTNSLVYNNATYISKGLYQFEIWPTTAGINNVTVAVGTPAYAVSPVTMIVSPGTASLRVSSTECKIDEDTGAQHCAVIHRDSLGNRVKACAIDSQGDTGTGSCSLL